MLVYNNDDTNEIAPRRTALLQETTQLHGEILSSRASMALILIWKSNRSSKSYKSIVTYDYRQHQFLLAAVTAWICWFIGSISQSSLMMGEMKEVNFCFRCSIINMETQKPLTWTCLIYSKKRYIFLGFKKCKLF